MGSRTRKSGYKAKSGWSNETKVQIAARLEEEEAEWAEYKSDQGMCGHLAALDASMLEIEARS